MQLARALTRRHAEPPLLRNPILRTANHDKRGRVNTQTTCQRAASASGSVLRPSLAVAVLFQTRSLSLGWTEAPVPSLQSSSISLNCTLRPANSSSSVLSSRRYCCQRALSDRRLTLDISHARLHWSGISVFELKGPGPRQCENTCGATWTKWDFWLESPPVQCFICLVLESLIPLANVYWT